YGETFTASGSFLYDATTHSVQDWHITADPPVYKLFGRDLRFANDETCLIISGCNYATWSPAQVTFTADSFTFSHSDGSPAKTWDLELDVFTPLDPDAGGVVPLIYGRGGASQGGLEEFSSIVTGGRLTGTVVPEPAIGLGIALGTMLWVGRK